MVHIILDFTEEIILKRYQKAMVWWNLRFSWQLLQSLVSSGMWHCAAWRSVLLFQKILPRSLLSFNCTDVKRLKWQNDCEWWIKIVVACFKILSRELVLAHRLEPWNSQIWNMGVNNSNPLFSSKCNVRGYLKVNKST